MNRTYGIAGNGRASTHLQAYFRLLKIPCKLWHRRGRLTPEEALGGCSTIFVLISDGAIARFIAAHSFLKGKTLIHFSGSLHVKGAYALHPFMPLSGRTLSLAEYRRIPFALDGGVSLKKLVPEFSNPVFRINKEDKALYHALCALGANLPVLLWQKAMQDLNGKFGIPREQVRRYFQASLDNFKSCPEGALSGPIARRDARAIKSDVKALGKGPYAAVYSAFARIYENN
jgi:predicted short-subunit dehydrogenase-like oxidoreductase (DUF2520 family)